MSSKDTLLNKSAEDLDLTLHEFLNKKSRVEYSELTESLLATQFKIMEFMDKINFYSERGNFKKQEYKKAMRERAKKNPPIEKDLFSHINEFSPSAAIETLNRLVAYLGKNLGFDGNVDIYGSPDVRENLADFLTEIAHWNKQPQCKKEKYQQGRYSLYINIDAKNTINLMIEAYTEEKTDGVKYRMRLKFNTAAKHKDYDKTLKRLYKLNAQSVETTNFGNVEIKRENIFNL